MKKKANCKQVFRQGLRAWIMLNGMSAIWAQTCDDAYWKHNNQIKYKKNENTFWDVPSSGERLNLFVDTSGNGGWYKFTQDMMWINNNGCPSLTDCQISNSNNQIDLLPNYITQNIYHSDTQELWTQFNTVAVQGDKDSWMLCKNPNTGNWISSEPFKLKYQNAMGGDCCATQTLTDSAVDKCIKVQRFTKPTAIAKFDERVYISNNPTVDFHYSTNYPSYEKLKWTDTFALANPPCDNNTWPIWFDLEVKPGHDPSHFKVDQTTGAVSYLAYPNSVYADEFKVHLRIGKYVNSKVVQINGEDAINVYHKLKIEKPNEQAGSNQCFNPGVYNYPLLPGWFNTPGLLNFQAYTIDLVNQIAQFEISGTSAMKTRTPCDIYHLQITDVSGNPHPLFTTNGLPTTPSPGSAMVVPNPLFVKLSPPQSTTPGQYQFKIKYCTFANFMAFLTSCDIATQGEFIKDPTTQSEIFSLILECPSYNIPVIGLFPAGKGLIQETMVTTEKFYPEIITNVNSCNSAQIGFTTNLQGPTMQYIPATLTTDAMVAPNISPSLHTQYQFEIRIFSPAIPPKFNEITSSTYTLIYGCPKYVTGTTTPITGINPSVMPWTLTSTTINFPYNQATGVTFTFPFPPTIGPTQCVHSWDIEQVVQNVTANIILDKFTPCGGPSASCTSFNVRPSSTLGPASYMTFKINLRCLQNPAVYDSSTLQSFTVNMRCPTSSYTDTFSTPSSYVFGQQTTDTLNTTLPFLHKKTFTTMCLAFDCCLDVVYVIEEKNHQRLTGTKTAIVAPQSSTHPDFGVTIDTTDVGEFDFSVKVYMNGLLMLTSALVNVKIECVISNSTQPVSTYLYDFKSTQEITITNFSCLPALCCIPMSYTTMIFSSSANIDQSTVLQTPYLDGTLLKIPVNTTNNGLGTFQFQIQGNNSGELKQSQLIKVNISCLSISLTDQSQFQIVTTYQDVSPFFVEITPPICHYKTCCEQASFLNTTQIISKNPQNLKSASLLSASSWFQGTKKVRVLVNTADQGVFSFKMQFNAQSYSTSVESKTVTVQIKDKCFDDVISLSSQEISGNERQAAGMPPVTQLIWQGYEEVKMNLSLSHLLYEDLAFNISQRFVSLYDCPFSDFKISQIENMNTSLLINSQFYTMNVSSSGILNITDLQEFSNLKVTIDAYNGFKWSTLAEPILVVQVYNETELNPPEPEPEPENPTPSPPPKVNITLPQKKPVFKVVEEEKKEEIKEIKEPAKVIVTKKSIEITPKVYVHKFKYVKKEEKEIEKPEIKEFEVPRLRITEINRKGNITIMFNQDLIIPGFVNTALNRTKMREEMQAQQSKLGNSSLLALGESESSSSGHNSSDNLPNSLKDIDVQKDVFETFIIFSEHKEDYSKYGYTVQMEEWTEAYIKLNLNFDNPNLISKTYDMDQVYFNIQNPEMFRARNSGLIPTTQLQKLVPPEPIPKQLPDGFDEDELRKSLSGAFQGIVYGQIIGAFFVKSAIRKMWHFFFYLQMYCAIPQIQQNFPVNLEIAFEQFRLIVFFEILKPDILLKALGIKMTMSFDELIWGSKHTDERSYFQTDPKTFLVLIALGLVLLLIASFIGIAAYNYCDQILKKVKEIVKSFFFNSTIQAIYVGYLPQAIGNAETVALMVWQHKEVNDLIFYSTYSILGMLVIVPLVFYIWLKINRFNLKGNVAKKKWFGELYHEIRLPFDHIHHNACFFYPWFLVRRLVYVWVCFGLYKLPEFQIPASMIVHMIYNCWMLNVEPLETFGKNMLIAFFDFTLVIITYFQMWIIIDDDFQTQWNLGLVIIAIPFVLVVLQVHQIVLELYHAKVRRKLIKQQKGTQDKVKIMLIALREDFKKRLIEQRVVVKNRLIADREMLEQARKQGDKETLTKKEEAEKAWTRNQLELQAQQFGQPTFSKNYDSKYLQSVNKNTGAARVNILKLPVDVSAKKPAQGKPINPRFFSTEDDIKVALREAFKMKLMPPEPIHFEVYPSILPKTKHVRLNHKKIVTAIESNFLYREGKDGIAFEQERTERELIRRKQSSLNADLSKKIETLRPGLQLGFLRDKIMEEDSCLLGSLEYELALTLELVHVFRIINQDHK